MQSIVSVPHVHCGKSLILSSPAANLVKSFEFDLFESLWIRKFSHGDVLLSANQNAPLPSLFMVDFAVKRSWVLMNLLFDFSFKFAVPSCRIAGRRPDN